MKRVWTCVCCLMLIGWLGVPVLGADAADSSGAEISQFQESEQALQVSPDITMSVRYDYDDQVRAGVTIPAFVKIENKGPAVDGILRLSVTPTGSELAYTYEIAVQVAQGAKMDITIPFRVSERRQSIHVHLLQRDRVIAEATRARTAISFTDRQLVGILSDNAQGMQYQSWLDTLLDDDRNQVRVVPVALTAADMPEEFYMLDRFALMILNRFDLGYLNEAQRNTLAQWVRGGGRLLVDADTANRQAVQSLQPIIDLQVTGTLPALEEDEQLEMLTSQRELVAKDLQGLGRVEPAGNVVIGSAARPLMMRYAVEKGIVFTTAFALDDSVLSEIDSAGVFRNLTGLCASRTNYLETSSYSYNQTVNTAMNDAVKSIAWLDAPSIVWVVLILLLFIVLAGPVSYWILSKQDKRDLIWITAPVLALCFCIFIAFYGVGRHGRSAVSSTVTFVDLRGGAVDAQALSLVGIAAPRRAGYELRFEEDVFPYKLPEADYYFGYDSTDNDTPAGRPTVRFDLSGHPGVIYPLIRQWSMETFYLQRSLAAEGVLRAEARYRLDGMHYTVHNDTGYDLEDVTIVSPLGYQRIALLEKGQTTAGVVQAYANTSPPSYSAYSYIYSSYSDYLYAVRELYRVTNDIRSEDEKREYYLKSRMISVLLEKASSSGGSDEPMVWAWSQELGAVAMNANGKPVKNDLNQTVLVGAVEVLYEDNDELLIPMGQIMGTVVDTQDIVEGYAFLGERQASFVEGAVTFSFELPKAVKNYRLDELVLVALSSYGSHACSLYNFATNTWDTYTLETTLQDETAQSYIDADGTVLLKVSVIDPDDDSLPAVDEGGVYVDALTIGLSGKEDPNAGN